MINESDRIQKANAWQIVGRVQIEAQQGTWSMSQKSFDLTPWDIDFKIGISQIRFWRAYEEYFWKREQIIDEQRVIDSVTSLKASVTSTCLDISSRMIRVNFG